MEACCSGRGIAAAARPALASRSPHLPPRRKQRRPCAPPAALLLPADFASDATAAAAAMADLLQQHAPSAAAAASAAPTTSATALLDLASSSSAAASHLLSLADAQLSAVLGDLADAASATAAAAGDAAGAAGAAAKKDNGWLAPLVDSLEYVLDYISSGLKQTGVPYSYGESCCCTGLHKLCNPRRVELQ